MSDPHPKLEATLERIAHALLKAHRDPCSVRLVGISKTATMAGLEAAWESGLRSFGHNRAQAMEEQHAWLPDADWHFVGPLQSNKLRSILPFLGNLQTLTSIRLAERLQRGIEENPRAPLPCFVQVNLANDGRHGLAEEEVLPFLESLQEYPNLLPSGLMTIAARDSKPHQAQIHFRQLRLLAEQAVHHGILPPSPDLSMGMSQDFEEAIAEGATLVRIGRALFPPLPPS